MTTKVLLELNFYISPFCVIGLEELIRAKFHHAGEDIGWEYLNLSVEVADIAVVKSAGGLDFILGVGQLVLELQEVLAGFQVRVILGYGKQAF